MFNEEKSNVYHKDCSGQQPYLTTEKVKKKFDKKIHEDRGFFSRHNMQLISNCMHLLYKLILLS